MKKRRTIRMSAARSPAAERQYDPSTATLIERAGFNVHIEDHGLPAPSFEVLQAALVNRTTDCILVPGEVLPQSLAGGVSLAAVLPRRSARMCLAAAPGTLHPTPGDPTGLEPNATVSASSMGQRAQLAALFPDLRVVDQIPQADCLASALRDRTLDAILIPADEVGGSDRMDLFLIELGPEIMLPPPSSGTTVIVARVGDPLSDVLAALDDPETRRCLSAERSLANALGWPPALACLATPEADGGVRLQATLAGEASGPRSALARVGAVATTPEAAAELCLFALEECLPGRSVGV